MQKRHFMFKLSSDTTNIFGQYIWNTIYNSNTIIVIVCISYLTTEDLMIGRIIINKVY